MANAAHTASSGMPITPPTMPDMRKAAGKEKEPTPTTSFVVFTAAWKKLGGNKAEIK